MYLSLLFSLFFLSLFTWVKPSFLALFLFLRCCIRRVLYFSQSPYLRSGICEGIFLHWYCETFSFSVENQRVSSYLPRLSEFDSLIFFFTVIGVRFVDITFSIMNGDKLDLMIMNLGKGASVSLSEESDLFKLRLNFLFENDAMSVIYFSLLQCSTTHHGV